MDVQADGTSLARTKPIAPGYLLTPLGWAVQPLAAMIQADPGLLIYVFELDRPRMHAIALALAYLDGRPALHLANILFNVSIRELCSRVLGRAPIGIKRILSRLPLTVLSKESYMLLLTLLDDPNFAKLLHHFEGTEITDSTVRLLYEVPTALRPALVRFKSLIEKLDHFPEALHWLASRGAAENFDALVADLARFSQADQFAARLKALIAGLPLPQTLPPAQIGLAKRVDAIADIRALAKSFKNCLATYAIRVDGGECAIYSWDDPNGSAICLATRRGRLGWCLSSVLGPKNVEVEESRLHEVTTAFGGVGVPRLCVINALESILYLH